MTESVENAEPGTGGLTLACEKGKVHVRLQIKPENGPQITEMAFEIDKGRVEF